jgi:hypothetical protein
LRWLFEHRDVWAPALIVLIVVVLTPFFPRWNAWLRTKLPLLFGRVRTEDWVGTSQEPIEVLRFVEHHEPSLFVELTKQRSTSDPQSRRTIELAFWLEHGLPLLGKYGPRASDDAVIDLFRYIHDIGRRLQTRGDGSSYRYLTVNPLDVGIGAQVDAAFYLTADRLLATILFGAIERPPQSHAEGEALFASAVQRAMTRTTPRAEDQSADSATVAEAKAAQYLAILHETLQSDRNEAAAILRHLLAITVVHPATPAFALRKADGTNADRYFGTRP